MTGKSGTGRSPYFWRREEGLILGKSSKRIVYQNITKKDDTWHGRCNYAHHEILIP
jgi:hypothetical protein